MEKVNKIMSALTVAVLIASTCVFTGVATVPNDICETKVSTSAPVVIASETESKAEYHPLEWYIRRAISESEELISYEEPEVLLNEKEVEDLACVIYQEAGSNDICDMCKRRVADVVLNRVNDRRFRGETIHDILIEPYQWGLFYKTGVVWPASASLETEANAVAECREIAEDVLRGNHSDLSSDYIWCAEFSQGTDVIYCCGIYYGK